MHGRIFFFVVIVQLQFHCIEFEVSKIIKRDKIFTPILKSISMAYFYFPPIPITLFKHNNSSL
jgi:hypothetical protein